MTSKAQPTLGSDGSDARLEALYRAHFDFVWRALRRYGVAEHSLDDATQDAFLVLRRRLADLDPDRSARAWLHGVARRVAHDRRRSAERRERRLALVPPPPPSESPERRAQQVQAASLVQAFLDTLDEGNREVFVLQWIEGLSGREIAQALGLNDNTVYARARRTKARFEKFVSARAEPPSKAAKESNS